MGSPNKNVYTSFFHSLFLFCCLFTAVDILKNHESASPLSLVPQQQNIHGPICPHLLLGGFVFTLWSMESFISKT
ncbi:UNVERIFIED_CONTAM: hypothetical protein NCL1_44046 [Trichonephila clavipes]